MNSTQKLTIWSDCEWPGFAAMFFYAPFNTPLTLYVETKLIYQKNILKRIWQSLQYTFGFHSPYGNFSAISWTPVKAAALAQFLNEFVALSLQKGDYR